MSDQYDLPNNANAGRHSASRRMQTNNRPDDSLSKIAVQTYNLSKTYGKDETQVKALDNVSIDFAEGKFSSIMGPSGSGKSTLMQALAGLDSVDEGTILISNTDITKLGDNRLTKFRRDHIGFVFQGFNLVPTLTAEQNIKLPAQLAKMNIDDSWFKTVIDTLALGDRLKHKPNELSGGQQQRVAIARALLTKPDVIFGDEPTGNLDSKVGAEVLRLMQYSTKNFGQTIIMVTHDPVAASYSDRIVLLKDGQLINELHNPTIDTVSSMMNTLGV